MDSEAHQKYVELSMKQRKFADDHGALSGGLGVKEQYEYSEALRDFGVVYLNPHMPLSFEKFTDEEPPARNPSLVNWEIQQLKGKEKLKSIIGKLTAVNPG